MLPFNTDKHLFNLKVLPQRQRQQYMEYLVPEIKNWMNQLLEQLNEQPSTNNLIKLQEHLYLNLEPLYEQCKWVFALDVAIGDDGEEILVIITGPLPDNPTPQFLCDMIMDQLKKQTNKD